MYIYAKKNRTADYTFHAITMLKMSYTVTYLHKNIYSRLIKNIHVALSERNNVKVNHNFKVP